MTVPALPGGAVQRLRDLVAAAPGEVALAVRRHDGAALDVGADRVVPSASTIKVPVLVAVLRAVQDGRLALDEPVPLPPPGERVGGSGPLELLPSLTALPVHELLLLMICLSDNDATNVLLDRLDEVVGPGAVAAALALVPTRATHLRRRLMDAQAAARGLQNETTAADLVDLLVALRERRLLDHERTGVALDVLGRQQFREGLPAYLPESVPVASKTGEIFGVRADVALVEPQPGRWAVVAVVATGLGRGGSGTDIVSAAGRDHGTSVLPTFAAVGEVVASLVGVGHASETRAH
ncbi:serine hydrolase [Lapillicoccus jejuensis]|uniref:Beta-lactamase class A n=1 Tax=Lapillicoccus jejuensis TaxID=402171 RepID=A0A542E416_9MICO|nr:serine hydrolase [Lapillicoccus jejuensis]TQJ10093.1 beta-lactamase class A [Lapillicoccus jejuensis]